MLQINAAFLADGFEKTAALAIALHQSLIQTPHACPSLAGEFSIGIGLLPVAVTVLPNN